MRKLTTGLTGTQVPPNGTDGADGEEAAVPWTIDNKYYTADITFEPRPLSLPVNAAYPVLLYVFSGQVRPSSPSPFTSSSPSCPSLWPAATSLVL